MDENEAAYNRSLRHQAMEWAASTASGSFLHPDLVIERAEAFIRYVRDGQNGAIAAAGEAVIHNEDTLARVRVQLVNGLGYSEAVADHLITELLNAGILFREREGEKDAGPIVDDMQWAAFDEQMTYHHPISKAKRIVFDHVREQLEKTDTHVTFTGDQVYVVWFCKTLQNWKALVSTTMPDGMYYEVTYDGDQHVAYLDAYKKFQNVPIKL